jgi:hypothetical protein
MFVSLTLCFYVHLFSYVLKIDFEWFQGVFLQRKTRGCQTISDRDLDACSFDSSVTVAKNALQQLRSDCNQVLSQFARDNESSLAQARRATFQRTFVNVLSFNSGCSIFASQISKLQRCLVEKQEELERAVAQAELRAAKRERDFEHQVCP